MVLTERGNADRFQLREPTVVDHKICQAGQAGTSRLLFVTIIERRA